MKMLRGFDRSVAITLLALSPLVASGLAAAEPTGPQHAIAMYGDVRYPADFTHFDYVDPDAPKGGTLALSGSGTFDSLNPFILRGTPAAGLTLMFETLMTPSLDEPFTYYGLVAESVQSEHAGSYVALFTGELDPDAVHRFFAKTLEEHGWVIDKSRVDGAEYGLLAQKDQRIATVIATRLDGRLHVELGVSGDVR